MHPREGKRQTLLRFGLLVGILILANVISVRIFSRLDLTEGSVYTLSDASRLLVGNLEDKFLIKAFFSSELPPPYNNNRRYLQDQLDEYRAYSAGNFQYEFIDPTSNTELEQEAQRYGIPPVQVQILKENKFQVEKAYMGIVMLYGDKHEVVPVIETTRNLEYDISTTIKKLSTKDLPNIVFSTGHGEPGLEKLTAVGQTFEKQYEVETVDLKDGKPVPAGASALLIVGPSEKFSDEEKFQIDQYLMRGGRIALFLNKVQANLQSQRASVVSLNLDDLLEAYGVRINNDLVRDVRSAEIAVTQQLGFMTIQNRVPYPYLPIVGEFNTESMVVKDLRSVLLYFASSIDTTVARSRGLDLTVLASTSNRSGKQEGFFRLDPTQQFTEDMFKESHLPLAVSLEGTFRSLYADTSIANDTLSTHVVTKLTESPPTRIVVVGDGDFMQDQYLGQRDNITFVNNVVDWLIDDIGLTQIRSRTIAAKPLEEVSNNTKTILKYINMILPPFVVVVAGVVRWRVRIARRKTIQMT